LSKLLSHVIDRRSERAERRKSHIAELRKRAAEADAKLKRLYDAIENGIADLSDPMLKDRITERARPRATRPQLKSDGITVTVHTNYYGSQLNDEPPPDCVVREFHLTSHRTAAVTPTAVHRILR